MSKRITLKLWKKLEESYRNDPVASKKYYENVLAGAERNLQSTDSLHRHCGIIDKQTAEHCLAYIEKTGKGLPPMSWEDASKMFGFK